MYFDNNYYIDPEVGESAVFAIAGILIGVLVIGLVIGITLYILQSIGLYTLAKRRGINNPWLAWIPVGNAWIIGYLADNYMEITELRKSKYRHVLLWLDVGVMLVSGIISVISSASGIGLLMELLKGNEVSAQAYLTNLMQTIGFLMLSLLISVTAAVFMFIAYYKVFKSCQPSNAVLYLLLSIFISVSLPIILFVIRNKDEGMIPAYVNPPYGEGQRQ